MALFKIVVWAIIFSTKLRFLQGISIATGIELLYDDIYNCLIDVHAMCYCEHN